MMHINNKDVVPRVQGFILGSVGPKETGGFFCEGPPLGTALRPEGRPTSVRGLNGVKTGKLKKCALGGSATEIIFSPKLTCFCQNMAFFSAIFRNHFHQNSNTLKNGFFFDGPEKNFGLFSGTAQMPALFSRLKTPLMIPLKKK